MTIGDYEKAFAALDEYIRRKMEFGSIPGLVVGLTDRERVIGCRYYGFANIDAGIAPGSETLFEIGSISKSFASVVALQLVEEGVLDLQRPVDEYLPWLQMRWKGEKFTMHHLMSHTAGLPIGPEATPEATSEVWAAMDMELGCLPGQFYHYSNIGYKIVGLVIEEVTGMSCADAIRTRILEPLGMVNSHAVIHQGLRSVLAVPYEPCPDDRPVRKGTRMLPGPWSESGSADGSISSTAEDMTAYLRLLLNRGSHPGGRIMSEESFAALTRPVVRSGDSSAEEYYAYGLSIEPSGGTAFISHTGGMVGYISAMRLDPRSGVGAIILTNGATDVEDVARYAVELLASSRAGAQNLPKEIPYWLSQEDACQYEGLYESRTGTIEIAADGAGGLRMTASGRSGTLQFQEKDRFSSDLPGFEQFLLRFGREAQSVVEVVHGGEVFVRCGYTRKDHPSVPEDHLAFCGHYRSCNPWLTNFRILLREGLLWMAVPTGEERELVHLGQGVFRIGLDERSPERITFEAVVNGEAQRAGDGGQAYARTRMP